MPVHFFVDAFGQAVIFFAIHTNEAMLDAGVLDKIFDQLIDELGSVVADYLEGAAECACPFLQRSAC